MHVRIIGPNEGTYLNVIGDRQWIKLRGEDTHGAFAMVEQQDPPGTMIPMHMHTREDETFYVAAGKIQFTIEDSETIAGAGTTVFLPKKTPHSLRIIGDELMRAMVIVSPSGCEKMFEELAGLPPGQPEMARVEEICNRYGVYFL